MEEKLNEILENYDEKIQRYETQVEKLVSKMDFCKAHNLNEEYRIANIQYDALNSAVHRWRNMHNEIKEVLNAWQS